jgi:hypothetical protein
MTSVGFDKPIYILPFDHRGSFQTKLFGWTGTLTSDQTAQIAASKQVIYDAFRVGSNNSTPSAAVRSESTHPATVEHVKPQLSPSPDAEGRRSIV